MWRCWKGQELLWLQVNSYQMAVDAHDIMSIGDDLLNGYPDTFSEDFATNKRKVEQLTELRSKRVRNRIAGYITRRHNRAKSE